MSAEEVITEALSGMLPGFAYGTTADGREAIEFNGIRIPAEIIVGRILEDFKDAGYAVIALPEPDSTRYEGDEHEHQDRKSWVVNDVFDVMVWNRFEVQVAEGVGLGWETREPLSAEIARQLGTALLAAAEAAEAVTDE